MEEKFLNAFKEAMEIEDKEVKMDDKFRDYEGWSSLKELSVLAMMDSDFGVNLEMKDFNKLITVADLLGFVKGNSKLL
jgi:acyl carrier protein